MQDLFQPIAGNRSPGDAQSGHLMVTNAFADTTTFTRAADTATEADKLVAERIAQQKAALSTKYGIEFAPAGSSMRPPVRDVVTGKEILNREPTLSELSGLEAALKKTYGEIKLPTADGKPLRIEFASDSPVHNPNDVTGATYIPPRPGFPATLRMWPYSKTLPDTEANVDPAKRDPRNPSMNSVEGILLHELSHGTDANLHGELGPAAADYQKQLGWAPVKGHEQESRFAIKGKDGFYYEGYGHTWVRRRAEKGAGGEEVAGAFVDKNGRPVSEATAYKEGLTVDRVRELAAAKPGSSYFLQPKEEVAEGLALYRQGEESRRRLMLESPEVYAVVKRMDQQELDKYQTGGGRKLRSADGTIVADTEEARRAVATWEAHRPS